MVTELEKLLCLKKLVVREIHRHEVYANDEDLKAFRIYFEDKLRVERTILYDIKNRLNVLVSH